MVGSIGDPSIVRLGTPFPGSINVATVGSDAAVEFFVAGAALHHVGAAPSPVLVKQRLDALAAHDLVSNCVGVPLVCVPHSAYSALELDAGALLYDVRSFVRDGVEIGAAAQHHVVAGRIGVGAHRTGRCRSSGPVCAWTREMS